jgi:hypothetical protein
MSSVYEMDGHNPVSVPNAEILVVIAASFAEFQARVHGLTVGTSVRVLDGRMRDWCGTVTALGDREAVVKINLLTFTMLVETPIVNPLPLPDVPAEQQVFYYCPLVAALDESIGDNFCQRYSTLLFPRLHASHKVWRFSSIVSPPRLHALT